MAAPVASVAAMPAPVPAMQPAAMVVPATQPAPVAQPAMVAPAPVPTPAPTPVPTATATPVPAMQVDQPGTYTAQDASPVLPVAATKAATPVPAVVPAKPSTFGATTIISLVGTCLLLLLSLLGLLGYLQWTKSTRWQAILSATKKGTEAFLLYAKGTPAQWDDALAAVLDNVAAVLLHGNMAPLSPEEQAKVKALATSFQKVVTAGVKPDGDKPA